MMKKTKTKHESSDPVDMDPFSTTLLDQLLETATEWRNVEDIIKLTFRAIADLVHLHGGSMKDIKNLLVTRASKTQLSTGLSLKSNVSDLSRAITQLSAAIDSKVSFNDLQTVLRDFVNRGDMQQVLASRRHSDPEESGIPLKKSRQETENMEITILQARMDDFQKQISKKVASCVSLNEFNDLINIVQQKVATLVTQVNVSQINDALEQKVSKQYLSTCLQKKIGKSELDQILSKKADNNDLEFIINSLENKASLATLEKLTQILENKADRSDLGLIASERSDRTQIEQLIIREREKQRQREQKSKLMFESLAKEVRGQIQKIKISMQSEQNIIKNDVQVNLKTTENFTALKCKQISIDLQQTRAELKKLKSQLQILSKNDNFMKELTHEINLRKRCQQKIYEEIDEVRRRAEEISSNSVGKRQFIDFKSEIDGVAEDKVSAEEVQIAFNKLENSINEKFSAQKQETLVLLRNVQKTLSESISLNSNDIMNLSNTLSKKQQRLQSNIVEEMVKRTRKEVEECRHTVDTLYSQMQAKLNLTEYESDLLEVKKRFDNLTRDMNMKANIKDVCILADSKPNIDDVNKALKELNTALQERISENDLRVVLKDQAAINETLCSQSIIGRWLWQSGQLKPGGLIPWQIQCANTVPDHFFWQKQKTSILILSSGIYQITACLFTKNGFPGIFVNGELITGKIEQQSVGKRGIKKRKQKEVSGSNIREYINLPSRSRISITSPIEGIEGFVNIRRM